MTYRDILVHVDNFEPCKARLAAAIGLAQVFDARLTGVYVRARPYIPPYAEAQISPELLEAQAKDLKRMAEKAGEMFAAATKPSAVTTQWQSIDGTSLDVFNVHARYFDLIVVGQGNPQDILMPGDRDMPDDVIMSCGRPAVVVPFVGEYPVIGRNVLVAWDGSATATRAVHDALPLLEAAKSVTVMGAYGHARWREVVLGGVTDHILNHMTVPVLMSH